MMRVGIIGCGGIARAHATAYAGTGKAQVAAVYDTDRSKAEDLAASCGARVFDSLDSMLREGKLAAVSVCTPPSMHAAPARAALEAGVSVCCEKPLAHTVSAGRELVECSRSTGTLLVTAFKFRFFQNVLWAKKLTEDGAIGKVVFARNTFAGITDMSGRWFSDKEVSGGGVMIDNGVHGVDLLRFLFGEVHGVFATTSTRGRPIAVEDSCSMVLHMDGDMWSTVDLSWATMQSPNILEIHGTDGLIELTWSGGTVTVADGSVETFQPPEDSAASDPFVAQLDWFMDCVSGSKAPRATAADGLRALEVIEAAYKSAENPGWIKI